MGRRLILWLLLPMLGACAGRQAYEPEQHPFKDVNQVVQDVYRTFPEVPASHVFVTYDYMALGGKRQLYVQQVRFYVPREALERSDFRLLFSTRARDLFTRLGSLNPECTSIEAGQNDVFFSGYEIPMREVRLEIACG